MDPEIPFCGTTITWVPADHLWLPLLLSPRPNQNGVFEFAGKEFSVLSTLTPSQGLKNWFFTLIFLSWDHLYIENMSSKFQVQKIYTKKIFEIYQHVKLWENFHSTNFDTFPKAKKMFFYHENFAMRTSLCWLYECWISSSKDLPKKRYSNLPTCVVRMILYIPKKLWPTKWHYIKGWKNHCHNYTCW